MDPGRLCRSRARARGSTPWSSRDCLVVGTKSRTIPTLDCKPWLRLSSLERRKYIPLDSLWIVSSRQPIDSYSRVDFIYGRRCGTRCGWTGKPSLSSACPTLRPYPTSPDPVTYQERDRAILIDNSILSQALLLTWCSTMTCDILGRGSTCTGKHIPHPPPLPLSTQGSAQGKHSMTL